MKFSITAKPKSKKELVKKLGDRSYVVFVKEEAKEGKANNAVVKIIADYFGISKSEIRIVSGLNIKQKIVEIDLSEEQIREVEEAKELQTKLF